MDVFFQELHPQELFWPESLLPIDDGASVTFCKQSAFVPYTPPDYNPFLMEGFHFPTNPTNMNKRMMELLRSMDRKAMPPPPPPVKESKLNNDQGYRHMMNERLRRKTMRKSYLDIHSLLPRGSKANKNSIVQTAALQLQKLQAEMEVLRRENKELQSAAASNDQNMELPTINLRVENPSSPIDSMIEVMKCLKAQRLKVKTIRSEFSSYELLGKLQIESMITAAAVEKSVVCTLNEVEKKFRLIFKEESTNTHMYGIQ